jgi:hypothetical protein
MVCQWFGLKTSGAVSLGLASKPVVAVSPGLSSKLVASGFRVSVPWTKFHVLIIK